MITFLKTILVILLVYYTLKFLGKLLGPYIMRFLAKKAAQRFENAFGGSPFQQQTSNAQEINRKKAPKSNPKSSGKVVGEYVDFEEVE